MKHSYRCQGCTGRGRNDFNLSLSVEWKLGGESFSRCVTLDETPIADLEDRIPYSELDAPSAAVDCTVAEITASVMREIDGLSNE